MRKILLPLFVIPLLLINCQQTEKQTSETATEEKEKAVFDLGKMVILTSGDVSVSVAPEQGGKIASLQYGGKEFLSLWDTHPDNWGSTFWASPQSIWGWPPPKAFDVLPYEVVSEEANSVTIQGQIDSLTGLSFLKTIRIDSGIVNIQYNITNNTDSVINVAPWEITRVPPNGLSFFPKGEHEEAPFTIIDTTNCIWFDYKNATIQEGHDKLKADASEGWLAHVNQDMLLVKFFPNITPVEVDVTEAEVEIYANPDKSYIELEPQGPLQGLEPGETLSWSVNWVLTTIPEAIVVKVGNSELVEFAKTQKEKIPNDFL